MKKFLPVMTIAAAAAFAAPASATDYLGKSDIDFFYAELEGGYAWFSGGEDAAPGPVIVEPDGGGYVTGTLGHVSIDNGIIYGYVDRAELWFTYADHGDDVVVGIDTDSSERDYWEIGTRFQHYVDQNAQDKTMWGFEPFIGSVDGEFRGTAMGTIGSTDATIYGAMISFESERHFTPSTMAHFRAAAGFYGGSSDASTNTPAIADDDFGGFRGQLAAGLTQQVTDTVSVGAVARLDYFSDLPVVNVPNSTMDTDDQLGVYLGVNVNVIFAGTYQ